MYHLCLEAGYWQHEAKQNEMDTRKQNTKRLLAKIWKSFEFCDVDGRDVGDTREESYFSV